MIIAAWPSVWQSSILSPWRSRFASANGAFLNDALLVRSLWPRCGRGLGVHPCWATGQQQHADGGGQGVINQAKTEHGTQYRFGACGGQ